MTRLPPVQQRNNLSSPPTHVHPDSSDVTQRWSLCIYFFISLFIPVISCSLSCPSGFFHMEGSRLSSHMKDTSALGVRIV